MKLSRQHANPNQAPPHGWIAGLVAAWTVGLLVIVPGQGQAAPMRELPPGPKPPELEGLGVNERLGQPLPLDARFFTDQGQPCRLGDFIGTRPVILTLNYYNCPMLCTLVLNGMVTALHEVDLSIGVDFDVVTLSIDARETPKLAAEKKARYVAAYGKSPETTARGWHFLTGTQANIDAVTNAVGFKYRYVPERDEFAHSAVLTLISPQGIISRYLYGVMFDASTLRLSLIETSQGRITPSLADSIVLFCFVYENHAGAYTLSVMRIMQAASILFVLIVGVVLWRALRKSSTPTPTLSAPSPLAT